jgi:hypothetical protein
LLDKIVESRDDSGIPENLYVIPSGPEQGGTIQSGQVGCEDEDREKRCSKKNWGPTLAEQRPRRHVRDGRSILEMAQVL